MGRGVVLYVYKSKFKDFKDHFNMNIFTEKLENC